MNRTEKLMILACTLASAALAAGCVPSLNYGSVPPEPDYTTKLTTTTATSATKKPFTTPKFHKSTISWEELNGAVTQQRSYHTEAVKSSETYSYTAFRLIGGDDSASYNNDNTQSFGEPAGTQENAPQTAAYEDQTPEQGPPPTAPPQTEPPQTAPPQTAPPQTAPPQTDPPQIYIPPQEEYTPPPAADPPPAAEDFGE